MKAMSLRADPLGNFNFRVIFNHQKLGNIKCGFNTLSGMGVTSVFKEYREGGNNKTPDLILESISTDPVVLSKGMTVDDSIYSVADLTYATENGVVAPFKNRFGVTIQVMDRQNTYPVKTYELYDCVVEQMSLGEMNAQGDMIMIENLVIRFNELIKR